jgi:preprotein translocase subunit SecB
MAANADDSPTTSFRTAAPAAGGPIPTPAEGQQPGQSTLTINAQYIKDLSFEAPNAAQALMLMQKNQPEISVNLDVKAQNLHENIHEVTLEIRTECKIGNQTGFVAELTYAGLVTMNVPPEHVQPLLLIECPRLLFPFARGILANMTRDGGFPPLMLGMVDFVSMYQKSLQQQGATDSKPKA